MPGEYIAIVAIMMVFGIPMVAILTHHQRKMAELIHRNQSSVTNATADEVARLREEVRQLRQELHQTAIALDDARRPTRQDIQQRVGE